MCPFESGLRLVLIMKGKTLLYIAYWTYFAQEMILKVVAIYEVSCNIAMYQHHQMNILIR